jgi:hypothetical protein
MNMLAIEIEAEARRVCDREGITDYETFQKVQCSVAHQAFLKAIDPYVRMKVHIHSLRLLDRVVFEEGKPPRTEYKPLSPELERGLQMLDEMIETEAERYQSALRRGDEHG